MGIRSRWEFEIRCQAANLEKVLLNEFTPHLTLSKGKINR